MIISWDSWGFSIFFDIWWRQKMHLYLHVLQAPPSAYFLGLYCLVYPDRWLAMQYGGHVDHLNNLNSSDELTRVCQYNLMH